MKNDGRRSPSSMRIMNYFDLALEALGIVYHTHGVAVKGLEYLPEDVLAQ